MSPRLAVLGVTVTVSLVAIGGLVLLFAPGEDDQEGNTPQNVIVGCDGSGARSEDVCTSPFLMSQGRTWQTRAFDAPDARFEVFNVGGGFSDTRRVVNLAAPQTWGQDAQSAMANWGRLVDAQIGAVEIESDSARKGKHSDLISLLVLCARAATEIPGGGTALVIATDGRLISLGFNAEKKVPTEPALRARMEQSGIHLDLAVFASVTVCGLNNADTTAPDAEALADLWRTLIRDLGGPNPTILSSCTSLTADAIPVAALAP